jgi:hypothetical protein
MVAYCDFKRRAGIADWRLRPPSEELAQHASAAEPQADHKPIRVEAVERQPLPQPAE